LKLFQVIDDYVKPAKKHVKQAGFFRYIEKTAEELDEEVEYDMDDQVLFTTELFYIEHILNFWS